MESDQQIVLLTFALYLLAMLIIGIWAYRRTANLADYILGGRRLGTWVTALSASASDMSGWLLLGLPGLAYAVGLEAIWLVVGLVLGTYLNWRIIASRLRRYSELADNALTLPEFFARRFEHPTLVLRAVSALFVLLFFLIYTAAMLVAGGKLFEEVLGWPYHWAVLAGGATILVYTFVGGFLAVSWTDLVQGLLMLIALLAVPVMVVVDLGGWNSTWSAVAAKDTALLNAFTDIKGEPLAAVAIISSLAWGLGYFGQPHILARFKAIARPERLNQARRIALAWVILSMLGALWVGISAQGYLPQTLGEAEREKVFIILVNILFHPVIAGVLLAAILAAIMSTADSQLLVSASVLTEDLYKSLLPTLARRTSLVWMGRGAVLVIALIATYLAWDPDNSVLGLVAYAWAGFGAAFGPVLILSLYWRRMNGWGALAGMLGGGGTVLWWRTFADSALYEIVPGFALAVVAIVVVSLLTRAPSAGNTAVFDRIARGT